MDNPQLIIGAIILPILIAYIIYVKNKYLNNDGVYIINAFLLGCVIVIPVLIIQLFLDSLSTNKFYEYFFLAAFVEESFKFSILLILKKKIFSFFDSLKFSVLSSLGFSMIENIGYAFKGERLGIGGFETISIRMFSAIPGHFIFGVSMGYIFYYSIKNENNKYIFLILSLLFPITLHGLYDFLDLPLSIFILFFSFILNYKPLKILFN